MAQQKETDKVEILDHEKLYGRARPPKIAESVQNCTLRNDPVAEAKAYRRAQELEDDDGVKVTFDHQGERIAVHRIRTVGVVDSRNKTNPTSTEQQSKEVKNYWSGPAYHPHKPDARPNNAMYALRVDAEKFADYENQHPNGNTYYIATSRMDEESNAPWADMSYSTNIYVELLITEEELKNAEVDTKTANLADYPTTQNEQSDDQEPVDLSLLEKEDDDSVHEDVNTSSIQAVTDWADANHTAPEVVKLLETELGIELDKNADDTLSKKGLCTVYAAIVRINRDNGN
jgi:hypothetical protein